MSEGCENCWPGKVTFVDGNCCASCGRQLVAGRPAWAIEAEIRAADRRAFAKIAVVLLILGGLAFISFVNG